MTFVYIYSQWINEKNKEIHSSNSFLSLSTGCKSVDAPIEFNHGLCDDPIVDRGSYQRLVGRSIYLRHRKLGITFVVGVVDRLCTILKKHIIGLSAEFCMLEELKGNLENIFCSKKEKA